MRILSVTKKVQKERKWESSSICERMWVGTTLSAKSLVALINFSLWHQWRIQSCCNLILLRFPLFSHILAWPVLSFLLSLPPSLSLFLSLSLRRRVLGAGVSAEKRLPKCRFSAIVQLQILGSNGPQHKNDPKHTLGYDPRKSNISPKSSRVRMPRGFFHPESHLKS